MEKHHLLNYKDLDEIIFKKIFGKSTKTLCCYNLDINLKKFAILQISMINDLRVERP